VSRAAAEEEPQTLSLLGESLGLQVLQRDWLSANHIVFRACGEAPATVIDTGYSSHAPLTASLIELALGGEPLQRILSTHLHSDHCGGNQLLQARHRLETWVPQASLAAARDWDEARLSFRATGQHCPRFAVTGALHPGARVQLGPHEWEVLAAPGHDPEALMFHEPQSGTLIAGDALWQDRLAVIFPELVDDQGFEAAGATLDLIEALQPRWVIPGHGAAFCDVEGAIQSSRARLVAWAAEPARHTQHASRALLMFHMMEWRSRPRSAVLAWLEATPLFQRMAASGTDNLAPGRWGERLLGSLVTSGHLRDCGEHLSLAADSVPS
jgi:glyoxylase-like metal-dependent hydrolase (beta-lactamase superfamily II)